MEKVGDGAVTINQLEPDLHYEKDLVYMNVDENLSLENITLINQNGVQSEVLTMGSLSYESLDTEIAEVDASRRNNS